MRKTIVGSQDRARAALRRARLVELPGGQTSPQVIEQLDAPGIFIGFVESSSFNWSGKEDEAMLVPRLIDAEGAGLNQSMAHFINSIAAGEQTDLSLEDEIRNNYSTDEIAGGIKEGISRWHSYKERE